MLKKPLNFLISACLSSTLLTVPVQAVNINSFTDVIPGIWYYQGIQYCVDNGLMTGYSETRFAPEDYMSRAMLVTVLHRMEGEPQSYQLLSFRDVPENTYFTEAVKWAVQHRIVTGYDANRFGPGDNITREQIATILKRYHEYKYNGYGIAERALAPYTDAYRVSPYAEEAMKWAVTNQIISGMNPTTLNPQGKATRAQVATILQRYLKDKFSGSPQEPQEPQDPEPEVNPGQNTEDQQAILELQEAYLDQTSCEMININESLQTADLKISVPKLNKEDFYKLIGNVYSSGSSNYEIKSYTEKQLKDRLNSDAIDQQSITVPNLPIVTENGKNVVNPNEEQLNEIGKAFSQNLESLYKDFLMDYFDEAKMQQLPSVKALSASEENQMAASLEGLGTGPTYASASYKVPVLT